jgi:hypothetical protein
MRVHLVHGHMRMAYGRTSQIHRGVGETAAVNYLREFLSAQSTKDRMQNVHDERCGILNYFKF